MINITLYHSKDGAQLGFNIKGHAGYAQSGSDIVCAAVSSSAYLVANTIIEVMGVNADASVDEDGEMTVIIPKECAIKTNEILLVFKLHIEELKKQYPKHVTITTTEV